MSAPLLSPAASSNAEADRIEADHEQGAALLAQPADLVDFFEMPKEIGMLHNDTQRLLVKVFP